MRTNIDINDEVLNEISRFKPATSKKELVNILSRLYLLKIGRAHV